MSGALALGLIATFVAGVAVGALGALYCLTDLKLRIDDVRDRGH